MFHNVELIEQLKQLGDPSRLRLVALLSVGELTVGEMTRITGLSQPRVSRHLRLMNEAGLLERSPDQNQVYYRLATGDLAGPLLETVLELINQSRAPLPQDRERLDRLLAQRQETAQAVLADLGIPPLTDEAQSAIADAVHEFLAGLPENPGLAVDVGTGTGAMLSVIGPHVTRLVGLDISAPMRLVARSAIAQAKLSHCVITEGDMYALPFEKGTVDLVTMDRVLGVAARPERVLQQALRILRPGGALMIVDRVDAGETAARFASWCEDCGLSDFRTKEVGGLLFVTVGSVHSDAQAA